MIPLEVLLTFFAASLLLALAPGPDNIFVLTQSALHGRTSGLVVTLGLCTGLIVHTLGVALGVAVIFQASAVAFTALKLLGAGYLLYLAWQIFRASATRIEAARSNRLSYKKLYSRGIIMNVTNPKVSIFFLAFLPQFTDPALGSVALQTGLLGLLFILSALLVFGGIALVAGSLGAWLNRSTQLQKGMNWLTGSVFIGLALKLVTTER
ncbi:MAG: LysE family translocator [Desulfuromonadales bacterium]|nr:LysE family translocator [Desulfuromonadales bacterium]